MHLNTFLWRSSFSTKRALKIKTSIFRLQFVLKTVHTNLVVVQFQSTLKELKCLLRTSNNFNSYFRQRSRMTWLGTSLFSPVPCLFQRTFYNLRLAATKTDTGDWVCVKIEDKLKNKDLEKFLPILHENGLLQHGQRTRAISTQEFACVISVLQNYIKRTLIKPLKCRSLSFQWACRNCSIFICTHPCSKRNLEQWKH